MTPKTTDFFLVLPVCVMVQTPHVKAKESVEAPTCGQVLLHVVPQVPLAHCQRCVAHLLEFVSQGWGV